MIILKAWRFGIILPGSSVGRSRFCKELKAQPISNRLSARRRQYVSASVSGAGLVEYNNTGAFRTRVYGVVIKVAFFLIPGQYQLRKRIFVRN
jgi:hypothetical protein